MPIITSKMSPVVATNYRWVMLGVYYLGSLAFGTTFQSIPAVLPLMIADLHLSYAEAGSLMSLFALLGVVLAIPIGLMVDRRHSERRIIIGAYVAMIVGTLVVASATSYAALLIGRLIAGAGGFATSITIARLISRWFTGKELGVALGLFATGMPLSSIVSLSLLGDFARNSGWPAAVRVGAMVAAVALLALLLLYRQSPASKASSFQPIDGSPLPKKVITVGLPVWLVGLVWFWFNASTLSFLTFGPAYFNDKGYSLGVAGFMTSVQMMASLFLNPFIGHAIDRYRQPELFMVAGASLIATGITLIPTSGFPVLVPLAILSVGTALIPTAVLYLGSKVVRPQDTGLAFGIINACLTASIIVGPFLVGLARDISGSYEIGFGFIAAFAVLCAATAGVLRIFTVRRLEG